MLVQTRNAMVRAVAISDSISDPDNISLEALSTT